MNMLKNDSLYSTSLQNNVDHLLINNVILNSYQKAIDDLINTVLAQLLYTKLTAQSKIDSLLNTLK